MNINKLRSEFKDKGFFKISNFFDKKIIKNLNIEIEDIVNEKNDKIVFYKDRSNLIRRMERFYNHTKLLNNVNIKVLNFLIEIFEKKVFSF